MFNLKWRQKTASEGKQPIPLTQAPWATYGGSNPEAQKCIKVASRCSLLSAHQNVIMHSESQLFKMRQHVRDHFCYKQQSVQQWWSSHCRDGVISEHELCTDKDRCENSHAHMHSLLVQNCKVDFQFVTSRKKHSLLSSTLMNFDTGICAVEPMPP